jgi:hypothetical protein
MFHIFPSPASGVEGFFGDRWQEDDHYYEFPQLHPGKKSMARQGGQVLGEKQRPQFLIGFGSIGMSR